jgi:hypothetical protein
MRCASRLKKWPDNSRSRPKKQKDKLSEIDKLLLFVEYPHAHIGNLGLIIV